MFDQLIPLLVAAVAGAVVMPVFQFFKKISAWLDSLNPWIKRAVVALLSVGAVELTRLSNLVVPPDIFSVDATTLQSLIAFGVATLLHFLKNKLLPAPTPE